MEHQPIGDLRQGIGVARVALFVDGDNLAPSWANQILQTAGQRGRVDLRRVYAAEAGHKAWEDAPGFRVIRVAGAKNGTDLLLCIEAVAAACRDGFGTFVIASDDRDFTHLAHWLREQGLHVLGIGTARSPEGWQAACSAFEVIEASPGVKGAASPPAKTPAKTSAKAPAKAAEDPVRRIVLEAGQAGITLTELGNRLSQRKITCTTLQAKSWRSYLAARPDHYALDPRGPTARVRWLGA